MRVLRASRRVAPRKIAEQEARRARKFDDVLGATDNNGGDAVLLQMPGRQTHGLMTYRSIRDENCGVDTIGAAARQQFGTVLFQRRAVAAVHRRTAKARRDLADPARYLLFKAI